MMLANELGFSVTRLDGRKMRNDMEKHNEITTEAMGPMCNNVSLSLSPIYHAHVECVQQHSKAASN